MPNLNYISRMIVGAVFATGLTLQPATADKIPNLLTLPGATITAGDGRNFDPVQFQRVVDGDVLSVGAFPASGGTAVEILFDLSGETVSPDRLTLSVTDAGAPVTVDILGSNVSENSGFVSLRSSALDPKKTKFDFRFRPSSARWILIRLTPQEAASSVRLSEIAVAGKLGLPETPYKFSESPARAIDIVSELSAIGSVSSNISPDELELFKRVENGQLTIDDFIDASLLASNVTDKAQRQAYAARIAELSAQAKSALGSGQSDAELGQQLLRWLHDNVLKNGYQSKQTELSTLLDTGTFNCVSSAVMFNIIGLNLGLDARAIEVPDHAFSIVYQGTDHQDVETTTKSGYNPSRDRIAEFQQLTGFNYIPQSSVAQRRELREAGLAALIYYNHGVEFSEQKRYYDALMANFKAMSLDPNFASATKNALAALANWSLDLSKNQRWEDALAVADIGHRLAPNDALLTNNHKAVWRQWADEVARSGNPQRAVDILQQAHLKLPDAGFEKHQAWIYIAPGETLAKDAQWAAALAATDLGTTQLKGAPLKELVKWRSNLHLRWMNAQLANRDFAAAAETIERGYAQDPENRRILGSVAFLGQEWAEDIGDPNAAMATLDDLAARFPSAQRDLKKVASRYLNLRVQELIAAGKPAEALALSELTSGSQALGDKANEAGAQAYDAVARQQMERGAWQEAGETYAVAIGKYPDDRRLIRNLKYFAQEWQASARKGGGVEAINEVTNALVALFPDLKSVATSGDREISRVVFGQLEAGDFAGALDYLSTASPFLTDKARRKLVEAVFDTWARAHFAPGEWNKAAELYARGLNEDPSARLLERNLKYVIQEWARTELETGGSDGLIAMAQNAASVLPENVDGKKVIATTAEIHAQEITEAGNYDAALAFSLDIAPLVGPKVSLKMYERIFDNWARTLVRQKDWENVALKYVEGINIAPDSRLLKKNMVYFIQEWAREEYAKSDAEGLIAVAQIVAARFPEYEDAQETVSKVAASAVSEKIKSGEFENGLSLADQTKQVMDDRTLNKILVYSYDAWARTFYETDWAKAVEIYRSGLAQLPDDYTLKNNLEYSLSKMN